MSTMCRLKQTEPTCVVVAQYGLLLLDSVAFNERANHARYCRDWINTAGCARNTEFHMYIVFL